MTGTWAYAGQHPISIKPDYQLYYDLFSTWRLPVVCSAAEYDAALRSIEELADTQAAAGQVVPPLYLILIWPRQPGALASQIELLERGHDYELYAVKQR